MSEINLVQESTNAGDERSTQSGSNLGDISRGGGVRHLCRLNEIREGSTVREAGDFSRVELIEASCDGNKQNKKT